MRRTWLLLSLLFALVRAGDAAAQAPASGTWFGFGAGGGWTRVSCAICSTDRDLGPAGQVRIGTSVRPGLLVGAGYEFPLSDSFAITNDLSLIATSFGALKNGDATAADDVSVTVLQLAVGIRRR
jgi:hypothetical protein